MKANYQLKLDKSRKKSAIVLQCSLHSKTIQYHVGVSVEPKGWSKKSHKVHSGVKDSESINQYLEILRAAAIKEYFKFKDEEKPFSLEYLKQYLDDKYKSGKGKAQYIDDVAVSIVE